MVAGISSCNALAVSETDESEAIPHLIRTLHCALTFQFQYSLHSAYHLPVPSAPCISSSDPLCLHHYHNPVKPQLLSTLRRLHLLLDMQQQYPQVKIAASTTLTLPSKCAARGLNVELPRSKPERPVPNPHGTRGQSVPSLRNKPKTRVREDSSISRTHADSSCITPKWTVRRGSHWMGSDTYVPRRSGCRVAVC